VPKLTWQTCSSHCSKSPRIPHRTLNYMYSFRGSSDSIVLMMRVSLKGDCTGSSLLPGCGIPSNLLPTVTGESDVSKRIKLLTGRIYYMYANMASLNGFRRSRGFSQCPRVYSKKKLTSRHLRTTTTLW
jgi:hypothetical protein